MPTQIVQQSTRVSKLTDAELYVIERQPLHPLHDAACKEVDRRAGISDGPAWLLDDSDFE